jgi:hypothetical protein
MCQSFNVNYGFQTMSDSLTNVLQRIICNDILFSIIDIHYLSIDGQKFNLKTCFEKYFQCNSMRNDAS